MYNKSACRYDAKHSAQETRGCNEQMRSIEEEEADTKLEWRSEVKRVVYSDIQSSFRRSERKSDQTARQRSCCKTNVGKVFVLLRRPSGKRVVPASIIC